MQILISLFDGILAIFTFSFVALSTMFENDGFRILGELISKFFDNLF